MADDGACRRCTPPVVFFWCFCLMLLTCVYNLTDVSKSTANFIGDNYHLTQTGIVNKAVVARYVDETPAKGYLIKTPGCTIPDLAAWDPLIKPYIFRERPVVCNGGKPPLFESNATAVYLQPEALEHYRIADTGNLTCCSQYFRRVAPHGDQLDKRISYDAHCAPFTNATGVDPREDFLRVKCRYNSKDIYKDFFHFVPLKGEKKVHSVEVMEEEADVEKLNVLVLGIDAVSRLNFHRQMPKTAFYLEKLQAVEMLGYNKIGDNTFPNLMAALSGHSEAELRATCWPNESYFFDDCKFVWDAYKRAGYTTAFGEDAAWMGLFYYTRKGFQRQPTDYFFDHFDIEATKEIGNAHRLNVDQCIGARQAHEVFLAYCERFAHTMHTANKPFFGFFWSASLSHDLLNKPRLGDQDFLDVLFGLDEAGVLNNTALIVLSDHGIRWGDIRSTYQGRMEERLPFLYFVLPEWYRDKYPEMYNNLRTNRRRLTTPYDLHATFVDLLNTTTATNKQVLPGISLFKSIPANRTCALAGIEAHWCTCQTGVKIAVTSPDVHGAVDYTVGYINEMLRGYADCYALILDEVLDAREMLNENEMNQFTKSQRDFQLTFRTQPGGAVFEATVRQEIVGKQKQKRYAVTGTISRINLYGDQSKCVSDFHLKLYCYCRSYLGN